MKAMVLVVLLSIALLSTIALADVPGLMNYQGTLTDDSGVSLDTTVAMTFSVYTDSTAGIQVWTETQAAVVVSSGIFNVLLGSVNTIEDTVFNGPDRWLGIQVGGDAEMTPRQRIASVGYAFVAGSGGGASDGDWTIDGDDMYSAVSGDVGIGTISPLKKLHVVGDDTLGALMVVPDELNSGEDAELILGEDRDATYHMKLKYDGGDNELQIFGQASTTTYGPHLVVERNTGDVGIGTSTPSEKLEVLGNIEISGSAGTEKELHIGRYDDATNYHVIRSVSGGSSGLEIDTYLNGSLFLSPGGTGTIVVPGPEIFKQPLQTVTYRFSPGLWTVRTDVGDVYHEPVGYTTSLMLKGGGAGNQNDAVMPLCLPRTGTIKEMRVRCRMNGPSGAGPAFQVVLLHQDFNGSLGGPSGDPTFFVYYDGSSVASMTLTETQDHVIQPDHTYLLFAHVYGSHVNYVEIGMVELDIETTEYGPTTRW
jgi:hypothetical protein